MRSKRLAWLYKKAMKSVPGKSLALLGHRVADLLAYGRLYH